MKCQKCGSENVSVAATAVQKKKKHSVAYWLCFVWLFDILLWVLLFVPRLLVQIFKKKTKEVCVSYATCQSCGHNWEIK